MDILVGGGSGALIMSVSDVPKVGDIIRPNHFNSTPIGSNSRLLFDNAYRVEAVGEISHKGKKIPQLDVKIAR